MDANKRLKLVEIGYKMQPTCGSCAHGKFSDPTSDFGVCTKFTYVHLKHSGAQRDLSVNENGVCPDHEWDETELSLIHGFKEFVK